MLTIFALNLMNPVGGVLKLLIPVQTHKIKMADFLMGTIFVIVI